MLRYHVQSTKYPEFRFRAMLTDDTQEVRLERVTTS